MRFKQFGLVSGFALLIGSIVVPASQSVNRDTRTNEAIQRQVADGMPLPPPPPIPKANEVTVVADGMPLPPPKPKASEVTLIADGMPLPPPKPGGNEVAV